MRTNVEIDDKLMAEALRRSGGLKTKRAVIEDALRLYVRIKGQADILELAGKVKFAEGYDYKKMRRSR
jgi:Arc/MetJ family transcription regulator